MTNIFIKVLKNIFLLIMSILKTLSSNYIPLLLLCLTLFYLLDFLSKRKLVLPCKACDNGSWYYKCSKNTGYGTRTCKRYTYITDTTLDFINLVNKASEKYLKAIITLIQHTGRVFKKFISFVDSLTILGKAHSSKKLTKQTLENYDASVLLTNHDNFDYKLIKKHSKLIIDTRGVYKNNSKKIYRA